MVGDVVGGYVVKEALASGRNGLLFLALHVETGHRAVVQGRLGEDDLQQFAAEAAQVLGLAERPHVERRRSRAGLAVLLAVVDRGAPGSGYTGYTNTERLPDLPRPAAPAAPRRRHLLALGGLVLLGGALGALLMKGAARQEGPAGQPEAGDTAQVRPAPSPPVEKPEVVQDLAASVVDASIAVASPPLVKAPAPPRVVRSKAARAEVADGPAYCDAADVDWKPRARADLNELIDRAAPHDELVRWVAEEEEAISRGIAAATTEAECRAIEQRVRRFLQRVVQPTVKKAPTAVDQSCQPDERWKRNSRLSLSDLRRRAAGDTKKFEFFEAREEQISKEIARASTSLQCAGVEASLEKLLQELND